MKGFFAVKNDFDRSVRRAVGAFLCVVILASLCILLPSGRNMNVEAAEYVEPNVRVAIVVRDADITSYDFSAPNGFRIGVMTYTTDVFTQICTTSATALTASIDESFYVEISSFLMDGKPLDLSLRNSRTKLKSILAPLELTPIPSYHKSYCCRIGPYSAEDEATQVLDRINTYITERNEQNETVIKLKTSVAAPSDSSVCIRSASNLLFSCASTDEEYGCAVTPIQKGDTVSYITGANSYIYPNVMEFRHCVSGGHNSMSVINILPLETYVGGVDSNEIYASWPLETHKVFAVVVRTFTMRTRTGNRHATSYSDLCSNTDCQAYRGIGRVTDRIREAVEATKGIVMTYNDALAFCYYYAVSGGTTVNCEECWTSDIPYLKAVPTPWERYKDYGRYTQRSSWHVEMTGEQIYNRLRSSGKHPKIKGAIKDVHIDSYCTNSSYVYKITFTDIYGNTSSATKSDTIRGLLGFNSGNFVVGKNGETVSYPNYDLDCFPSIYSPGYTELPITSFESLTALDANGTAVAFDPDAVSVLLSGGNRLTGIRNKSVKVLTSNASLSVTESGLPDILSGKIVKHTYQITLSGENDEVFVFEGRGWGHGIGFSQYGIWDLDLLGYDFDTILQYYLRGIELKNLKDLGYS